MDNLASADKLAARMYTVSQSIDASPSGAIKPMHAMLVQCTLISILGHLNRFYRRIKEHRGSGKAYHRNSTEITDDYLSRTQKPLGIQ